MVQLILSAMPSLCSRPVVCPNQPLLWVFGVEKLEIIHLNNAPMHLGPCAQNIEGFCCCFMMSNENNKAEGKESVLCCFQKPKYE